MTRLRSVSMLMIIIFLSSPLLKLYSQTNEISNQDWKLAAIQYQNLKQQIVKLNIEIASLKFHLKTAKDSQTNSEEKISDLEKRLAESENQRSQLQKQLEESETLLINLGISLEDIPTLLDKMVNSQVHSVTDLINGYESRETLYQIAIVGCIAVIVAETIIMVVRK